MDGQNQQPEQPSANSDTAQPGANLEAPIITTPPTADKPKLEISDAAAQSLLALNGMQSPPKKKLHLPVAMLLTIGVVIALLILISIMLDRVKAPQPAPHTNSSTGSNSQSGDNQINRDVNSCSNVVNAVSEC